MSEKGLPLGDDDTLEESETEIDGGSEGLADDLDDGEVGGDEGDESGDGGEDDAAGEDEGEEDGRSETVKPPSRAARRIQALDARTKAAEETARRTQEELATVKRQLEGRTTEQEQAIEREKVALMSPDEKIDYYRQKDRQELDRRFGLLQFQNADSADKTAFEGLCARNKACAAIKDQVEDVLANERRAGQNPRREVIAKFLLGDKVMERAGRAATKQRKTADANIRREKARPGNSRGDVGSSGRGDPNSREARRKRLEDQQI